MRHFFRWSVLTLLCLPAVVLAEFVGISRAEFQEQHYRRQKDRFWCWASSAEMVLSYQGVKLPQEEIVERIKGMTVSATGSLGEMVQSTNAIFTDIGGRDAVVSGQIVLGAPLPTVLYNQLKQKKPVVLTYQGGSIGHAVVLTGIDATVSHAGVQITKLYVFDPFSYTVSPGPWGPTFTPNTSLIYREYMPQQTPYGIAIPPGLITAVILMNGSPI